MSYKGDIRQQYYRTRKGEKKAYRRCKQGFKNKKLCPNWMGGYCVIDTCPENLPKQIRRSKD